MKPIHEESKDKLDEWCEINSSSEEQSNQIKGEISSIGNHIKSVKSTISDLFDELQMNLNTCSCFRRFFALHQEEFVDELFDVFFEGGNKTVEAHDRLRSHFDSVIQKEINKNENISLYNILGKYHGYQELEEENKKFIKQVKDNYFLFYLLIKKTLEFEFNINLNENQSLQIIFISFPLLISSFE